MPSFPPLHSILSSPFQGHAFSPAKRFWGFLFIGTFSVFWQLQLINLMGVNELQTFGGILPFFHPPSSSLSRNVPISSPFPPLLSLSSPFPSPSLRSRTPYIQLGGLGERCELPQWGLGRSPSRHRIWCILALKYDMNQSINLYFRHWTHRTIKNIKVIR